MRKDIVSEEELQALLGDSEMEAIPNQNTEWDQNDRKLLHALVRNQLRLLHMIEELQSEVRRLKSATADRSLNGGNKAEKVSLEPLPLPFMKSSQTDEEQTSGHGQNEGTGESAETKNSPADLSRRERFKRKSLW